MLTRLRVGSASPLAVDAAFDVLVGTRRVAVTEAGTLRANGAGFIAVPGLMIIPHVAPHALDDRDILPVLEVLRGEVPPLQVQPPPLQSDRFGSSPKLDLDDPEFGTLPKILDLELALLVLLLLLDFLNQDIVGAGVDQVGAGTADDGLLRHLLWAA